jgi:hypothetical protein
VQRRPRAAQELAPYYAADQSVIIDPFNEPRDVREPSDQAAWRLWKDGGGYDYDGSGHRLPTPLQGSGSSRSSPSCGPWAT